MPYDSKRRFASYWHQINEIAVCKPTRVLEVGVGTGFVSRCLRDRGISIVTCDVDPETKPDVVASIMHLPFPSGAFEVVAACEVLEHLPYEDALAGLRELLRVSARWVIISLPDATPIACIQFPIPYIKKIKILLSIPYLFPPRHQTTKHGHYWEIGKRGHPLKKILDDIRLSGFNIKKTYRVFENPYHRFFVLEKK